MTSPHFLNTAPFRFHDACPIHPIDMNRFKNIILTCVLAAGFPTAVMAQTAPEAPNPEQNGITYSKEALTEAYQAERWGLSVIIANELLKSDPENADILSILGVSCAHNNDYNCAKNAFEKVRDLKPDDPQVYANLCATYTEIKFEDHIETCIEATKRLPENHQLLHLTGKKLENLKRLQEAHDMYEAAWKLDPQNIIYLTAATNIDFQNQNFQQALELTEKGLELRDDVSILYLNAISAAMHLGDYEKALKLAETGYEKYKDPVMMLGKAEALDNLGKFVDADPVWQQIRSQIDDKSPSAHRLQLGLAKHLMALSCTGETFKTCQSDTPDACCAREKEITTLLDAIPTHQRPQNYKVYLGIAQTLDGQLEKAEATLTKAVNSDMGRDNASALAALAAALYQYEDERDKTAAKRYFTQALNASPDFADLDQLTKTRAWPPRLVETLKHIQDDIAAGEKKKTTGCGCNVAQDAPAPWGMMIPVCLALFALALKRRKNNA